MSFYCEENVYLLKLFWGNIMKYLLQVLLLFVFSAILYSCDDVDLSGTDAGEVRGMWQKNPNSNTNNKFLLISDTEFVIYDYNVFKNCVITDAYQVIKKDGTGFFQVEKGDGSPEKVFAVSFNSGQLNLRSVDDRAGLLEYYWPSEVDASVFTECIIETDIQGQWEFANLDESTYLDISDDTLTIYSEITNEDCFEIIDYRIDGNAENIYKLIDQVTDSITAELFIEMRRTEAGLEVSLEDNGSINTDIYSTSNTDFTSLTPTCGPNFPDEIEGIWEFESVINTAASLLHLELKQDTLRYYTEITDQSCTEINSHLVRVRRGDNYFLSNDDTETVSLIYQIFFDNDVLVTRINSAVPPFDERFLRSSATSDLLKTNICSTDF